MTAPERCEYGDPDHCEHCGVELSPLVGLGCCDDCAERLRVEREVEDDLAALERHTRQDPR